MILCKVQTLNKQISHTNESLEANAIVDPAKRAEIMQNIEKMLYDDAAFIPLHWQDLAWAAKKTVDIEPVLNVLDFPYLGDLVVKEE